MESTQAPPDMAKDASRGLLLIISHQDTAGPSLFGSELSDLGMAIEVASFADGNRPKLPLRDYLGIIILGGTPNTDEVAKYPWLADEKKAIVEMLDDNVPTFGICLGGQLLAEVSGASVGPMDEHSRGWSKINLTEDAGDDPIFGSFGGFIETLSWHKYAFELPPSGILLAYNDVSPQAFRLANRPVWGVQFHPEASPESIEFWFDEALRRGDFSEEKYAAEKFVGERCRAAQGALARTLCQRFVSYAIAQRESTK